jgi:hypothetical protein
MLGADHETTGRRGEHDFECTVLDVHRTGNRASTVASWRTYYVATQRHRVPPERAWAARDTAGGGRPAPGC